MDTSKITGKTYLPIFINESLIDYGDEINKVKEKIKANKTSGFNGINKFYLCKRLIF
jgi:hypothetical protein